MNTSQITTKEIEVPTSSRTYQVTVGAGILEEIGSICRSSVGGDTCCVISDSTVAPLYAERVSRSLKEAGYHCFELTFPAGESSKRITTLEHLLEQIAQAQLTRDDLIVAVGGGVTGDMAGLAAALYLRGIQVVQVPTSLLAMVDSSIGGKTAVDLAAGKNLIGAFLQPSAVLADVQCLSTISPDLFRDSCGEVIKHGVIADADLFSHLEAHPLTQAFYDQATLVSVIARNIEIKRDVVSADEKERGLRQTLNFGHTIGHAVEAASNFSLGHGTCVAIGMCCIARAAYTKGWCESDVPARLEAVVATHGLPIDTDLSHDLIVQFATHDKKRHGDGLNVIIPSRIGEVEIKRLSLDEFRELVTLGCGVTQHLS
ncbi:MAG TPA: 3-dehydroquinate synthase [Candidatus Coprovicinus avistercoris]|uniref:3-dehydroquinate synthase n=1 Tax=Candidatus Coprovicinus avistercoris TaxID=2840754 RepID=A0A9D1L573_9ACTN|nr:3-dehydroquinate synthase [Candidatus Coprovicinus avistercoris]